MKVLNPLLGTGEINDAESSIVMDQVDSEPRRD